MSALDLTPPRRRWRKTKVALAIGIPVVVIAACVGFVMSGSTKPVNSPTSLSAVAGAPASMVGSPAPILEATAVAVPSTLPPDTSTLNGVLQLQDAALLAGNEKAWLAAIDPKAHAAITEYQRIFHNMRAMHVTKWEAYSPAGYVPASAKSDAATIDISYCLLVTSCTTTAVKFIVSQAEVKDHALIETFVMPKPSKATWDPLPWEVSTLSAVVGPQVVVAASSAEAGQLKRALPIAVSAAANANRFALWGKPPVYVAYLADSSESRRNWFGVDTTNAIGEEIPVSNTDLEALIIMPAAADDAGVGGLSTVIRHEFGHIATLQNDGDSGDDSLVEGLAEYVAYNGHSTWSTYRFIDARRYIRSGKWSKDVIMSNDLRTSTVLRSSALYCIGYLTLRYLAQTYGQAAMLTFWGQAEQYDSTPDAAAEMAFHASWKTVNAAAVAYIEHTVHA